MTKLCMCFRKVMKTGVFFNTVFKKKKEGLQNPSLYCAL